MLEYECAGWRDACGVAIKGTLEIVKDPSLETPCDKPVFIVYHEITNRLSIAYGLCEEHNQLRKATSDG